MEYLKNTFSFQICVFFCLFFLLTTLPPEQSIRLIVRVVCDSVNQHRYVSVDEDFRTRSR